MDSIIEALKNLDVSKLSYQEWINVGMALKVEGFSVDVWDSWSRNDSRYKECECQRKWESFKGSSNPVGGGSIVQLAKDQGWSPVRFDNDGVMNWDDVIEYDGDGIVYAPTIKETPIEQLIKYLKTLFKDDEYVSYVSSDVWHKKEEDKWFPNKGFCDRTAAELIRELEKHPNDIGAVIGDTKPECGAWIRFNPVDGKGAKNENVTRFTYALVESDDMPIAEQDALYRKLELPIACLVHSGGKSLHAIVRVDAKDAEEYRKRVDFLYDFLETNGLKVDRANRNPSRLSRMPGVLRNGVMQTLVATNIGRYSYADWLDFAEGLVDELPPFTVLKEMLANMPDLPPELLEGLLRIAHKMLLAGPSKGGKSFLLMELCVALSEGTKWLKFKCKKSKVLYVNLEIDKASCIHRFAKIYKALNMDPKHSDDIVIWNLRGKAMPLDKLVPLLIRKVVNHEFGAIVIDPIYKIIMGDENNASEMGEFCNQFDKICNETGCSTIYCHHHSKGAQGFKRAMDRASGSGVFGRDPDAQIDMIEILVNDEFKIAHGRSVTATAWRLEGNLREFPNFKPFCFWFDYPIHIVDETGDLEKFYANGDTRNNLNKSSKRNQTPDSRKEEFDNAFNIEATMNNGVETCTVEDLMEYLDVSERVIRERVREFKSSYKYNQGVIARVKKDEK